ncbi:MAG: peptide deformylase [Patescibacteria group bacterium]|nr:peptide deformylase [Patescibacteria group bacterium]
MKRKILTEGDPRLRKKSLIISNFKDSTLKSLTQDLTQTMYEEDGVGIAAPQVGQNVRLIVVSTKDKPLVLINPVIISKSWRKETLEEGCLSVPGVYGLVKRSKNIKATYQDKNGVNHDLDAKGLLARVIQHEVDHLDGILFIDRVKNYRSKRSAK